MSSPSTEKSKVAPNNGPQNGARSKVVEERPVIGEIAPEGRGVLVHREALSARKRWSWSKKKRDAFKLVLQGTPMAEAARRLAVHRHTVENWSKAPEWRAEIKAALEEAQLTTRLRRMKLTTVITDRLGAHSLKALEAADIDTKRAGLVLREHLNYAKAERELYGERDRHAPGQRVVNIVFGTGTIEPARDLARFDAKVRFEEFMAGYDPALAVVPINADAAAAMLTERSLPDRALDLDAAWR